jgi:hypothetical protein
MDISKILPIIRPNAQWVLNGDDYSGLTWLDDEQTKPTLVEIQNCVVPQPSVIVTFRSLAFAMLEAGIYAQVKAAAIATVEGEIWWETAKSNTVQRNHPFVAALASAVGQTTEQIDAIFATAATKDQANPVAT